MSTTLLRIRSYWAHTRQRILESGNPPWLLKKTVARCAAAVLALASFSFFAAAIVPWNQTFVHTSGSNRGDWQDGIPIAPLALAFLYNTGTTIFVLKTARRVPFVFEMVVDFFIWAGLVPGLIFSIWAGTFNLWQSATTSSDGMIMCSSDMNALSRECFPELYRIGFRELAGIVLAVPVWFIHVFLFAHRIVETFSRSQRVSRRTVESIKEIETGVDNRSWPTYPNPPDYARRPPPSQQYPSTHGFASYGPPLRPMPSARYV